ncbi:MAG TPA: SDR family oxidoreductase [Chthonomonadaceae bacterium]|nr:SDR family oxidoreductase [Chthonomonadaceae bacterium]
MRTALVTGGAGFIGSHLVGRLLERGWRVRVLDDFSSGSRENLLPCEDRLEVIEGDTREAAVCQAACRGVEHVFHLAAIASVVASVEDPIASHAVTLGGTLNMLLAARDQGARRFVFSSSASVYGNAESSPTGEEQPLCPESPYASAKAAGELYCRNFTTLYGLETVVLRYFNVFGPRQSATSSYAAVIPLFVRAAITGCAPIVYGDGRQTRDFVYVENVVAANLRAAEAEGVAGQTFNIAGGQGISLLDLLALLEQVTDRRLQPEFRPARAGEVRHSCANISRARCLLGYEPSVSLTAGLQRTVEAARAATANAA